MLSTPVAEMPCVRTKQPPAFGTVKLDGIPVAALDFEGTIQVLSRWLSEPGCRRMATANADFLRLARTHEELREALLTADLVSADGVPLLWMSRASGSPLPERVAGSDIVPRILRVAGELGAPVYLLGGAQEDAEAAKRIAEANIKGLNIVEADGALVELADEAACEALATRIRNSGAHLLLVGFGCPKQELFLLRYLQQTGCRLGIGVGTSFSFVAGTRKRAPTWMRRMGMEWLFRACREPRRLIPRYAKDLLYLSCQLPRSWWGGRRAAR